MVSVWRKRHGIDEFVQTPYCKKMIPQASNSESAESLKS